MIKAVIFDYDDTLVQSSKYFFGLQADVCNEMGIVPATWEEYFSVRGKPYDEMVTLLHPGIDLAAYLAIYDKLYDPDRLVLFDGTIEMLEKFKAEGIITCIVSSKKTARLAHHLNHLKIAGYFAHIQGVEASPYPKPDPRVFDDVLAFLNLPKNEIVYVGDALTDWEAADKAGLHFVGIISGVYSKEEFEKAGCKHVISSIKELEEKISHL